MKDKIKGLIVGILIGVALTASTVIATTGVIQKNLHYNNIKITLNGKEIKPVDANGVYVEPFIIDGTTYLPVRAVSGALGLGVAWDGETNTVKLTGVTAGDKTSVEAFVENFGSSLEKYVEDCGKEAGFNYNATVSADGNVITIDANVAEVDNVSAEEKAWMQTFFDSNKNDLKTSMADVKEMVPSLQQIIFNVRDKDGDLIATLDIAF